MYTRTKQEVLDYLNEKTADIQTDNLKYLTAIKISEELTISRSLASQYLNELYKESELLKINTRPVVFISREIFENLCGKKIHVDGFATYEEFLKMFMSSNKNFSKAIGSNISLKDCILRMKKACNYPNGGLPIVIQGIHGSGKTFVSQLVYEYCRDTALIPSTSKYCSISCNQYNDSSDKLIEKLFGKVVNDSEHQICITKGLLEECENGILILDDILFMDSELQERLVHLLDKKQYQRVDDSLWKTTNVRIIFTTSIKAERLFDNHLLNRMPCLIELPSLEERTIEEKRKLVLAFFEKESKNSKYTLKLSEQLLQVLISNPMSNSISYLKKTIVEIFSNAIETSNNDEINIRITHLPNDLKNITHISIEENCSLLDELKNVEDIVEKNIWMGIFDTFEKYQNDSSEKIIDNLFKYLNEYNEQITFQTKYVQKQLEYTEKIVNSIITLLSTHQNITMNINSRTLIAKYVYRQSCYTSLLLEMEEDNHVLLGHLKAFINTFFHKEKMIEMEFSKLLEKNFGMKLSSCLKLMIILNLRFFNRDMIDKKVASLVICHGFSTASSISNAVNTMIEKPIFDAIDMPLQTSVKQIIERVKEYIDAHCFIENLLVFVDMGSLEKIGEYLKELSDIRIGVVNNISTALILDAGYMINENKDMEYIVDKICANSKSEYHLFNQEKKEKAIVFTSESGTNTANRMQDLFEKSMPKPIALHMVSSDYFQLKQEGRKNDILKKYDILFIAGIFDPQVEGIPFIALGEIINFRAINKIDKVLFEFLKEDEIQLFHNNLVKNFSLQNVVENITILNPAKLLDSVEEAMLQMQQMLNVRLDAKTMIGLYVHICCFIERMITRTPIKTYTNLEQFIVKNKMFIQIVNSSFEKIMHHYNVEFPESEIAYIYDYIKNDEMKEE